MKFIILIFAFTSAYANLGKLDFFVQKSTLSYNSDLLDFSQPKMYGHRGIMANFKSRKGKKMYFSVTSFGNLMDQKKFKTQCDEFLKSLKVVKGEIKSYFTKTKIYHQCAMSKTRGKVREEIVIRFFPKRHEAYLYSGKSLGLKDLSRFKSNFNKIIKEHKLW